MHSKMDVSFTNKVTKYFLSVRQQRDGTYNVRFNVRYHRVINQQGMENLLAEALRIVDNSLFFKVTYERAAEMLGTRSLEEIIKEVHQAYLEWRLTPDAFEYYRCGDEAILDAGKVLRVAPTGDEILTLDTYIAMKEKSAHWNW